MHEVSDIKGYALYVIVLHLCINWLLGSKQMWPFVKLKKQKTNPGCIKSPLLCFDKKKLRTSYCMSSVKIHQKTIFFYSAESLP